MITVNATLVVQVVHFLFVWWLLHRFLLKDFVCAIAEQDLEIKNLALSVEHERALLQESYGRKSAQWEYYRLLFVQHSPVIIQSFAFSLSAVLCPLFFDVTPEQKNRLVNEATKDLIKQVFYV